MKKLIFTAIMALFSYVALAQVYNISFKVPRWATETMGKEWDLKFDDVPSSTPVTVNFNGKKLTVTAGSKTIIDKNVISVKKIDNKKTTYGVEVKTGEGYILTTQNEQFFEYYIIKKNFLEDNSFYYMLYAPLIVDAYVFSYDIFQSDILK